VPERILVRLPAVGALIATVAAGLAVRAWTGGAFAKYAGVALYATAAYAAVLVMWPTMRLWVTAAIALGWSWAVELFQLTPVPADWSARGGLARLVWGTTFSAADLAVYPIGVVLAYLCHRAVRA
jgi:hypothetical protein